MYKNHHVIKIFLNESLKKKPQILNNPAFKNINQCNINSIFLQHKNQNQ